MTRAVIFDVDFTLIYPGPTFQAGGYQAFGARYGLSCDPALFEAAVRSAGRLLEGPDAEVYDDEIHVKYTRHILEQMGGRGEQLDACAREMYAQWAACHHFELYEDVPQALRALAGAGVRLGLVSNSNRCLETFQAHFALDGLISATVSSADHGMMKPHPSIFLAALRLLGVEPADALMVGDSVPHDVDGALGVGMRAALLHRSQAPHPLAAELRNRGVPIIRTLQELPAVVRS